MKVFLAGTYSEQKNLSELKQSPYLLESFYYIKPWQLPLIKNCKMFLLDSGAFTFMNSQKATPNWEKYIDVYCNFIIENNIDNFFELDIDSIVGYEKVKDIRKYIESKTQKKCIPVWHKKRGLAEFEKMCDEYSYAAIGGIVSKEITEKEYVFLPKLLDIARNNNCKIHGLGFTSMKYLDKIHFYSVDSTRWNCARFGQLEIFDGKTMQPVDKRNENKKLKGRCADISTIGFIFNEWVKFQHYAERNL